MPGLDPLDSRRGITVLALLLLIIAVVVGGFFVARYLLNRPAATSSLPSNHSERIEGSSGISFLIS